jgi:hypothetical protein
MFDSGVASCSMSGQPAPSPQVTSRNVTFGCVVHLDIFYSLSYIACKLELNSSVLRDRSSISL